MHAQFLLEDSAGQWHISQSFAVTRLVPSTRFGQLVLDQPTSAGVYSHRSALEVATIGAVSTPDSSVLSPLDSYVEVDRVLSNTGLAMEYFQVTAVPEPSSTALSASEASP